MKKLFIIIFFFTALSYSQVLKGRIPVDQNGRPVNHYVVDDTIVTNLKSYVKLFSQGLISLDLIPLSDYCYASGGDTLFFFDSDKKIYSITINVTSNNDSNSYLLISNKNQANYIGTVPVGDRLVDFYSDYFAYILFYNESVTLYDTKLSDILVAPDHSDVEIRVKYESY
ncbi:MAG: hypothetical protein GYA62_13935 [Bacteroidales bacterium]|nr:hypothetical protein [Bacteroidales bacterium]